MYQYTARQISEKKLDTAIIPVGSLEQHGPHLPVMTDWAIAAELGKRVAEKTGAFLLPALPISTCREQMGIKGSVWMEPMTFYQMMTDIVMSLKVQGFKRVGILQCHGGIFVMTPLVRDLNAKNNPDLQVAVFDVCSVFGELYQAGIIETNTELHAGEVETSQILAIAPETVHMEKAVDEIPQIPRNYLSYGSLLQASASGVWGEPTKATAQKGEKIFAYMADRAAEELGKAFDYMNQKQRIDYSDF